VRVRRSLNPPQSADDFGVNSPLKVGCLIAGIVADADSVDEMDLLRHGAMDV
jgi:hypothetical protein